MSALPMRANQGLVARVVARPPSEGVLEAFIGAVREVQDIPADEQDAPIDEEAIFLWGRARQHWPLDAPASHMIVTYGEAIAERLGLPPDDLDVRIMATAIANVMWVAFRRWLDGGGTESFNVVVEHCFTVLARLNDQVDKPAAKTSSRRRRA